MAERLCEKCGLSVGWDTALCPQCGSADFYESPGVVPGDLSEEERQAARRRILIWGAASLVVLLVAIAVWSYVSAPQFIGTWKQESSYAWFMRSSQEQPIELRNIRLTIRPDWSGSLSFDAPGADARRVDVPFDWRQGTRAYRRSPDTRNRIYFTFYPERSSIPPDLRSFFIDVFSIGWEVSDGGSHLTLSNQPESASFTRSQ